MIEDSYPEATLEETYRGYTIFIENNADQYRDGYEYSVLNGNNEIENGLVFTIENGIREAKEFIDARSASNERN